MIVTLKLPCNACPVNAPAHHGEPHVTFHITRHASTDVTLDEERARLEDLPSGDAYEMSAFMMMAESGADDIVLVSVIHRYRSPQAGLGPVATVAGIQTSLMITPRDQRGLIQDNAFIGNRTFRSDWSGDARVAQEGDAHVWRLGGLIHESRPPYWRIQGEHLGVTFDLVAGGRQEAARTYGPWNGLQANGSAGYELPVWWEGSVQVNGRTYPVDRGQGTRGRTVNNWDLAAAFTSVYLWTLVQNDRVALNAFIKPGATTNFSDLTVDGQKLEAEDTQTTIEALRHWTDPKTGLHLPCQWRIQARSHLATVDLVVSAGPRVIYSYLSDGGVITLNGHNARVEGAVTLADGTVFPMDDALAYAECGRNTLPLVPGVVAA